MSGGIAYVYDLDSNFAQKCNTEMVDLDPCDEADKQLLLTMLQQHQQYTGSTVAGFIANDIDNQLSFFVKIFPKDYKKVLAAGKLKKQTVS
jgi:glutamate synthase (NADPH/NADH) large chain